MNAERFNSLVSMHNNAEMLDKVVVVEPPKKYLSHGFVYTCEACGKETSAESDRYSKDGKEFICGKCVEVYL